MHKRIKQVNIFSSVDKYSAVLSFGILSKFPLGRNRSLFIGPDSKISMKGARKLRGDLAYRRGTNDHYGLRKQRLEAETGKKKLFFLITE